MLVSGSLHTAPLDISLINICRNWYRVRPGTLRSRHWRFGLHCQAREDRQIVLQLDCRRERTLLAFVLPFPPSRPHSHVDLTSLHTVLIAYRVWVRQNPIRDSRRSFSLSKEAAIIVESAGIYFVTLICLISTYTRQSNAFNVFLDMVSFRFFLRTRPSLLTGCMTTRRPPSLAFPSVYPYHHHVLRHTETHSLIFSSHLSSFAWANWPATRRTSPCRVWVTNSLRITTLSPALWRRSPSLRARHMLVFKAKRATRNNKNKLIS